MIDWRRIFETEVAPTLSAHGAPVPRPVVLLASVLAAAGVAALVYLSSPRNLAGLAPLLLVAFGAWAVSQNRAAARNGAVVVRQGVVMAKRTEKILTDSTTTGLSEARTVHVIVLALSQRAALTADGAAWEDADGDVRLTTSEALYDELVEGSPLTGISLPIAPAFVHLAVAADGRVTR